MQDNKEKKDDSMEAIKLLVNNHPVFSLCFVCLALYGVSMMLFYTR